MMPGESVITLKVSVHAGTIAGTFVLQDPDHRLEMPISNPRFDGDSLEFETIEQGDQPWYWVSRSGERGRDYCTQVLEKC